MWGCKRCKVVGLLGSGDVQDNSWLRESEIWDLRDLRKYQSPSPVLLWFPKKPWGTGRIAVHLLSTCHLLLVSLALQGTQLSGVKTLPFSFSPPIPTADAGLHPSFLGSRMLFCLWCWEASTQIQKQPFSVLICQCYGVFFSPPKNYLFH